MQNDVSRRLFLAGAGSLATSALSAVPSDRTTVGMIAVGARAHQLLEKMQNLQGVEIASVFDGYNGRMERAIEKTGGRAKRAKSYQAILEDSSIDAVTIASPDHWHAKQCIEALEAGKHVYCEKPLTYTIDEGLEIAAAVERTGKILQVGSQGISMPNQQRAREYVQSGKLGRVTMVRAYYNRNSSSGAWIYPIPARRESRNRRLGPLPRLRPQAGLRPGALLPLALLQGVLRRHRDRSFRPPLHHHPLRDGR